ncbi:hypothetical protein CPC08DRAFT_712333 [Agrocybe pediades]|nr:hypothetical protein CPC08DRAFT_712333 [Agrocybe pediades]
MWPTTVRLIRLAVWFLFPAFAPSHSLFFISASSISRSQRSLHSFISLLFLLLSTRPNIYDQWPTTHHPMRYRSRRSRYFLLFTRAISVPFLA